MLSGSSWNIDFPLSITCWKPSLSAAVTLPTSDTVSNTAWKNDVMLPFLTNDTIFSTIPLLQVRSAAQSDNVHCAIPFGVHPMRQLVSLYRVISSFLFDFTHVVTQPRMHLLLLTTTHARTNTLLYCIL